MCSILYDNKGRKRASIFYKAAFYDTRADISTIQRFTAEYIPEDNWKGGLTYQERDKGKWAGIVKDQDEIIWQTEWETKKNKYDHFLTDRLRTAAANWLNEHYPDWNDATKYWD